MFDLIIFRFVSTENKEWISLALAPPLLLCLAMCCMCANRADIYECVHFNFSFQLV